MSIVLDALRKLDRERSFRHNRSREIPLDKLRGGASRRRTQIPYWAFGIIAVMIVGISIILTTYPIFFSEPRRSLIKVAGPPQDVPPSEQPPLLTESGPSSTRTSVQDQNLSSTSDLPRPLPPTDVPTYPDSKKTQKASPGSFTRKAAPAESKEMTKTAAPQVRIRADEKAPVIPRAVEKSSPGQIPENPALSMPARALPAAPVMPQEPSALLPPREPAPSPSTLKVWAIVWDKDPAVRMVVINGKFLNEGDSFEGIKVMEILPERVRLLREGRPFELAIFSK